VQQKLQQSHLDVSCLKAKGYNYILHLDITSNGKTLQLSCLENIYADWTVHKIS